ncbi:MAG: hypothetical protein JHD31_06060 [Rhodoluna sp.]|nr:hypothetical protein [Rhodoluna sp.]
MSMFDENQKSKGKIQILIGLGLALGGILLMFMPYFVYGAGWQSVQIWPGGGAPDMYVLKIMLCIPGGAVLAGIGLIVAILGANKSI